jgi:hypothetical protein
MSVYGPLSFSLKFAAFAVDLMLEIINWNLLTLVAGCVISVNVY